MPESLRKLTSSAQERLRSTGQYLNGIPGRALERARETARRVENIQNIPAVQARVENGITGVRQGVARILHAGTRLPVLQDISVLSAERARSAALDEERMRYQTPERQAEYQAKLRHVPGTPELPDHMFEYTRGTGPQPHRLAVLVMGNAQNFNEENVGMRALAAQLSRQPGMDVLLFRSGDAITDIRAAVQPTAPDHTRHTAVVLRRIEHILHQRLHGGIEPGELPPTEIVMGGYSFGGGVIEQLSQRWNRMTTAVPVSAVALIDAVQLGSARAGIPVTERPEFAGRVLQFSQGNNVNWNPAESARPTPLSPIVGAPIQNPRPGDEIETIRNTGHREIQDPRFHQSDVLDRMMRFLTQSGRQEPART